MIPKKITRKHVIRALEEIDREGVPAGRTSSKFLLCFSCKSYPPKYVISLANKFANGIKLESEGFSGGVESNNFLTGLGFRIKQKTSKISPARPPQIKKVVKCQRHNERCCMCKRAVRTMLERLFGRVETNFKFRFPTNPEQFRGKPYYSELKRIYSKLRRYSGFEKLIRSKTLPNCDFFVPDPGFIVEFDESQHFTIPRKIALATYPEKMKVGYDRPKWMTLCDQIHARDNDPPFRDEQRAWYDTLRDFIPHLNDLGPTVRLFSKDIKWCDLNPDDPNDVNIFKNIIGSRSRGAGKIEVIEGQNPLFARIIIARKIERSPAQARELIDGILNVWPRGKRVEFLIACGGFVQFDWPMDVTREDIKDNWNPERRVQNALIREAEKCARLVLTKPIINKLKKITNYITLGVDTRINRISMSTTPIGKLSAELVLLFDVKNDRCHWTGKSYPTPGQQESLVRITDHDSHFVNLNGRKILLLGCHDLNIFNNRNWGRTGARRLGIKNDIRARAARWKPAIVLHHPHSAVKVKTWSNGWSYINRSLPSVELFAGAGCFYEPTRRETSYDDLKKVLSSTKRGESIDFVVW